MDLLEPNQTLTMRFIIFGDIIPVFTSLHNPILLCYIISRNHIFFLLGEITSIIIIMIIITMGKITWIIIAL